MRQKSMIVLGGDLRQYYMAELLAKEDFAIFYYGDMAQKLRELPVTILQEKKDLWRQMEETHKVLVLPVPVSTDGKCIKGTSGQIELADLADRIRRDQKVYGGNIPKELRSIAGMKQGNLIDFMKSDRVAIRNAVATAEGVIAEAITLGKCVLHGSKVLVIGYGRCAEVLAAKLMALNAEVTVMARDEKARIRAESYGCQTIDFSEKKVTLTDFSYIFNTVPACVIDEPFLTQLDSRTVILDIASAPGGVNYEAAAQLGISAKLCPGLPGKYAPENAGQILAYEIMRQQ